MKPTTALLLLIAGLSTQAFGGEIATSVGKNTEAAVTTEKEESIYDKIWGLTTLYKNKENPIIQELALQGRIHLQYAYGDSDEGNYGTSDRPEEVTWGDEVEVRRWRLGLKSKLFNQFTLDGMINVSPDIDPFYDSIYDLRLIWSPNKNFNLGVGKRKANYFGLEQGISSNNILTVERSLLSNTLFAGELVGAWADGKAGNFLYGIGVYAAAEDDELDTFSAGEMIQVSLGYDYSEAVGAKKAFTKLEFQHSTDEGNAGGAGLFDNAISLNSTYENGRFGFYSDVLAGFGQGGQGDVFGVILMPAYYIVEEKLQAVLRYQFATGDSDSLRLQSRYERLAPDLTDGGRGEQYNAVYAGLNYYLYGHKLKFMGGVEYHNMDGGGDGGDFDGVTFLAAFRLSF
ncbi:hypothetical protein FEM03_04955 [Phragmitibacter flavus]|uniref:Porin n=1 Tax=Phragmitibacter flavus TaxID=2576071 RepID=A0A5R8KID6_9BACT|nr:hypothetical protein [Phragmitibacter flavus]TLD72078.1 hypothetical protein FEM03_04955 [Phragmitibacter flavus]